MAPFTSAAFECASLRMGRLGRDRSWLWRYQRRATFATKVGGGWVRRAAFFTDSAYNVPALRTEVILRGIIRPAL